MKNTRIVTKALPVAFPHFGTAFASIPGAKEKFTGTILIDKNDTETINMINAAYDSAIEAGVAKVFNGKMPAKSACRSVLKDGDESTRPEFKSKFLLSVSSINAPQVVDINLNEINGDTIVGGDIVRVACNLVAYNVGGSKGCSVYLQNVQLVEKTTKPFTSRIDASSDFASKNNKDFM